jgi:hypothetical protein
MSARGAGNRWILVAVAGLLAALGFSLARPARTRVEAWVTALHRAKLSATRPALAWDGKAWGVAYAEAGVEAGGLLFRRLAADATPLGPAVTVTPDDTDPPALAFDASAGLWTVAWIGPRGGKPPALWAAHLDAHGAPAGVPLLVKESDLVYGCVRVAAGPRGETGVAWFASGGERGMRFARVSRDGARIGGDAQLWSAWESPACMTLAWNGAEYGVAYVTRAKGGDAELMLGRVSGLGERLDDPTWVGPAGDNRASLVWDGSAWAAAWATFTSVYFARMSPRSTPALPAADPRATDPSLAWTGDGYGVVWTSADSDSGAQRLVYARLAPDGTPAPPVRLPLDPAPDYASPALVWNGTELGLAYERLAPGGRLSVYLARLDRDGNLLAPPSLVAP